MSNLLFALVNCHRVEGVNESTAHRRPDYD